MPNLFTTFHKKNYAEANKYLKDIIDSKLKDRIESCLDNKLF